MSKIRVGVLRGGPSAEHEVSLKTGRSVLVNMPECCAGKDIFINKNGEWYFEKMPVRLDQALRMVDIVFNALHGEFGEDGKIQKILETHGIPYTGSGVLSSALGMNKSLSREIFKKSGLKTPIGFEIENKNGAEESAGIIFKKIGPPWLVKPVSSGSSVGVSVAKNLSELVLSLENAFTYGTKALVEELVKGREATCGVLDDFRGLENYVLPVIEIVPPQKFGFFNYDAKYGGETKEICPANFDMATKKEIERLAVLAHRAIGARHYSRSDFIVSKKGIYILEVNTLPGLTDESLLPKAMTAVGSSHKELIGHLINLAVKGLS